MKMSLASKEARETKSWLRLLQESQLVNFDFSVYLKNADEIVNILSAIIKTSQSK